MGLLGWWRSGAVTDDRRLRQWREAWRRATAAAPDEEQVAALSAGLDSLGLPADDIEIEREMLQALIDRQVLALSVHSAGLPVIETGHRVVGKDYCHFSAPASMPEQAGEPAGRLLLTNCRAIFVGGPGGTTAPWHAIAGVMLASRDIVLVRRGREDVFRFRCNTYSDALRAVFIAEELCPHRPSR
jgi:hypothetical protein